MTSFIATIRRSSVIVLKAIQLTASRLLPLLLVQPITPLISRERLNGIRKIYRNPNCDTTDFSPPSFVSKVHVTLFAQALIKSSLVCSHAQLADYRPLSQIGRAHV